jgi:hypothetical protein
MTWPHPNKAALIRDLRNAAITFQMRTLEMILRHNPHSSEAPGLGEGQRPEPSHPNSRGPRI